MRYLLFICAAVLSGCASYSGVISTGNNNYMISKQAATGFSGLGNLKAEVVAEASAHCASQQKGLQVISSNESKPPYILGNYPRVELQFTCTEQAK